CNSPALGQNRSTRYLGGMRGKDWLYFDVLQRCQRLLRAHTRISYSEQGPAERTRQRCLGGVQLSRAPAALAVIGFSQVGQLEINGEGLGDLMGLLHTQRLNNIASLVHVMAARLRPGRVRAGLNKQSPKLLDSLKN